MESSACGGHKNFEEGDWDTCKRVVEMVPPREQMEVKPVRNFGACRKGGCGDGLEIKM